MTLPHLLRPRTRLALAASLLITFSHAERQLEQNGTEASRSEVRQTRRGWELLVDGEPFHIRGAGLGSGSIESLAAHGANSLRTWSASGGRRSGRRLLDEAQEHGLKVMMGLEVGRERHGFDYDDEAAVAAQLERIRGEVIALKDHPALILWGIGNELNHHSENPRVWDAVNQISIMIHGVDPDHLTTTSLAGMERRHVDLIQERAPDLDILSVQMYADIDRLPQSITGSGWEGPLLVTEWGATGYWEVARTSWGAPLENDSSTKADFYWSRYERGIESEGRQLLGSYVFLWGQKQERTPTWFGMFTPDGRETEAVHVMHRIWTGDWPGNRAPRVEGLSLDGKAARKSVKLRANRKYRAAFDVKDPEGDPLTYRWEILRESESTTTGGDREAVPERIEGLVLDQTRGRVTLRAPEEEGAYRLFAYCDDTGGNTAHANIPFLIE